MLIKAILISVGKWMDRQLSSSPPSDTIGDTKIIDGKEYWNMGDLYDQDNWRYIGPATYEYFINLYQEDARVFYALSLEEDVDAIHSEGFYNKREAEEKLIQYKEKRNSNMLKK
ncbi:hypothetical protein BBI11_04885 [Planococcus maritimus]|nr:hypothetical protein BBI11_04885 [Planococcus maritimus]